MMTETQRVIVIIVLTAFALVNACLVIFDTEGELLNLLAAVVSIVGVVYLFASA